MYYSTLLVRKSNGNMEESSVTCAVLKSLNVPTRLIPEMITMTIYKKSLQRFICILLSLNNYRKERLSARTLSLIN